MKESESVAVGIDPGRRVSGLVVLGFYPALNVKKAVRIDNRELCKILWTLPLVSVAIEGFRLYPWVLQDKQWDDLPEVRLIGAVEEICRVRDVHLIVAFPSEIKRTITDEVLRELGTWSTNPHITDAFRVFWYASL